MRVREIFDLKEYPASNSLDFCCTFYQEKVERLLLEEKAKRMLNRFTQR
jgi:hypothetical protein